MILLVVSLVAASSFKGRWYFWHRPTWVFSLDMNGIFLGPSDDPVSVGPGGGLVVWMLAVSLPVWAVWRLCWAVWRFRARRSRPAAG